MQNFIHLESDYNNGVHPEVLHHLMETNALRSKTYGFDEWSEAAREKIRQATNCPEARVEFLVGGTQTNATLIDSILQTGEGVLAVETAHIAVHESGAVESSGHKVITLPSHDGKMLATDLSDYLERFFADETYPHMVQPGMVYITMPTELGSVYSAREIEAIESVCRQYDLPLFVDGARLGYGLMSDACDFDLPWLARHCHAFYIGGTKVGALCGEAVVFPKGDAPRNFFTHIKRHGALLAKSRLAGVQFDALFTDNLYFRISQHAIKMAQRLREAFVGAGFKMFNDSPTNQQFVIIPNRLLPVLQQHIGFECWQPLENDATMCRFVTSWATEVREMDCLADFLKRLP